MTWSTRELAELAGTTVNAVRHYHALGLLDAPERSHNGYKHYRVRHLVRLIQVRRLTDLGVPLGQIRADDDAGVEVLGGLQQVDAQARAHIERLNRARSDIAALLRDSAPVHTPRGFESVAAKLSVADRALIQICARLHDDDSVSVLKEMVVAEPARLREEFDELRSDAPEAVRESLAQSMADSGANWRSPALPWLVEPAPGRQRSVHAARITIDEALDELYTPAQRDVLDRARDRDQAADDAALLTT